VSLGDVDRLELVECPALDDADAARRLEQCRSVFVASEELATGLSASPTTTTVSPVT
jgi:hypothetical protein